MGSQPWRVRPPTGVYGSLEQPRPVGPGCEQQVLVRREAGGDEVLHLSRGVDGGDDAIAGAGQRAGTFDDLVQGRCPTWRLALVRRMAALSRESRSRSASVSCLGWSGSLTDSTPPEPRRGAMTSPDAALEQAVVEPDPHGIKRICAPQGVLLGPSRLIGHTLCVRLYHGRLDLLLGASFLMTLPRRARAQRRQARLRGQNVATKCITQPD